MEKVKTSSKRDIGFDLLRVVAAFAVVIIHTAATVWRDIDVDSTEWLILTVWCELPRFCVCVFFMISGAFLLDNAHKSDIKTTLVKRVPKIAVAFVFWTCVYTVINILRVDDIRANLKWIVIEFFTGEYHMWFLFALLCLYLATPILKVIANDEKLCKYYLVLFGVFQLILPVLTQLPKIGIFLQEPVGKSEFCLTMGYSGYYVLGYYLKNHFPKGKTKALIYLGGIIGAVYSVASVAVVSRDNSVATETTVEHLSWNIALMSVAVFAAVLSFAKNKKFGEKTRNAVTLSANYSFGVYLAHPLVLWVFEWIGFVPTIFTPIASVPVIAICTALISFAISFVLRKIPKIGKMIT